MKTRLNQVAPLFQKYDSPISVAVRMAQFALESQAGQSVLFKKSNNGFGIKASAPYTGDKVLHNSMEVGGAQDSYFRKYPSLEASVKDHASFFTSTPYRAETAYKQAIEATNYKDEANALTGIYAGDPKYGEKLIKIIEDYNLTQYDKKGSGKVAKLRTPIKKHTLVNSFGSNSNNPKFIVIHYVGAAGQALANANYFYNVNRNASAHIFIDKNVTYEVVPEHKGAWHIGDGNSSKRGTHNGYVKPGMATNYNSLGIEMCLEADYSKPVTDWPVHPNVYEQTLLQTQAWMKKYNIPIENVIRHYDASQKLCPANWRFNNWAKWWEFKTDLSKLVKGESIDVGGSTETSKYNPQGLQEVDLPEYREPIEPCAELKAGDSATPREVAQWYNPETEKYMLSPNMPNYIGKADKVKEVKEVSISYSKRAYLLENTLSWILEQDLEETRAQWPKELTENTYTVQKGDYLAKIAKEFDISVEDIKAWNNLETNVIHTGMTLFVVKPDDLIDEDRKPDSTDDNGEGKPAPDQPGDKGDDTPAVELKENQYLRWDGVVIETKVVE